MERNGFKLTALAGIVLSLLVSASAQAATFNVTTDVDEFDNVTVPGAGCSLREAVQAANTGGSYGGCSGADNAADTVRLNHPSYVLTRDGVDDTNDNGDLDILNEPMLIDHLVSSPPTIAGDADGVNDDRVIEVHGSIATGPQVIDFLMGGIVITGGRTTVAGGGIYINGPPAMGETFTVSLGLLTVTGNMSTSPGGATPGLGGGIANESAEDLDISESTISGNSAAGSGGGIDTQATAVDPADTQLENVTISNNTADSDASDTGAGGGVSVRLAGATGTFYNTIVAGNFDVSPTAGTAAPDCNGTMTSGGYNLVGSTANCAWVAATGDLLNVSAGLAPLAPIPGAGLSTVLAHDLLPGSLAREAGHPGAPGSADPFTCGVSPQNGGLRPRGPRCDIGSVETTYIPPAATPAPAPTTPRKCVKKKKKKKKKKRRSAASTSPAADTAAKKKKKKKKKKRC